jgi:glycosyltransferase involved in cell wall biosynthesis
VDSVFLNIAKLIKKVNPSIHICLIAPDLPEYMSLNEKQSLLTRLSRAVDLFLINKSLNIVDSFVLITEHMKDPLKVGNRPYVVVEGMVPTNSNSDVLERNKKEKIKSILYTGTLIKKYGILQLLSAFSLIDDENYRLIICGSGEAEAEIKANCKLDKRVSFMGLLAPERIKDLQEKATVLVNPRQNDNSFTKYSFPSKIMEYLISGTATVAYKLSGMPDEYTKYIFYIEGDSPQDMADKLIYVCEMDPSMRNQFANNARNYVLSNKNNVSQTQKIFKMFKDTGIK